MYERSCYLGRRKSNVSKSCTNIHPRCLTTQAIRLRILIEFARVHSVPFHIQKKTIRVSNVLRSVSRVYSETWIKPATIGKNLIRDINSLLDKMYKDPTDISALSAGSIKISKFRTELINKIWIQSGCVISQSLHKFARLRVSSDHASTSTLFTWRARTWKRIERRRRMRKTLFLYIKENNKFENWFPSAHHVHGWKDLEE